MTTKKSTAKKKPKKTPNPFKAPASKKVKAPAKPKKPAANPFKAAAAKRPARTARLDMRATPEEKKKLLDTAKKAGVNLTDFVLSRV